MRNGRQRPKAIAAQMIDREHHGQRDVEPRFKRLISTILPGSLIRSGRHRGLICQAPSI
jgi:hypothetical protein